MKTLTQLLNESLHGITVRQYKGIWQGKFDVNLDEDHLKNPIYFFTELLYAHKQSLPTTEEFTNVCKFIALKMKNADKQLLKDHSDLFFKRFVEIYFTDIIRGGTRNSYDNMNLWDMSSNDVSNDAKGTHRDPFYISPREQFDIYIYAVFFGRKYLDRATARADHADERDKMIDKGWKNTINELGKKYKLTTENWPDYSIGLGILKDAIKK